MNCAHIQLDPNDPDDRRDEPRCFLALAASTPYEELRACYLRLDEAVRGLARQLDARGGLEGRATN